MRGNDDSTWPVVLVAVVVIGAGAAGYYFWKQEKPPAVERLRLPPAQTVPKDATGVARAIQHPIEQAEVGESPEAESRSQPPLPESDATFEQALEQVVGHAPFHDYFIPEDLVDHIVVTLDNLPREKVARRLAPVQPVEGQVAVAGGMGYIVWSTDNYARYARYVGLLQALDMEKLATVYARYYALFQQAYEALGYPNAYFNDRLVEVIDHLLATPDITAPIKLVQPGVMYRFADPDLEARSAGQKILIRMGSENAAIVKARLRELRQLVTRPTPP